MALELVFPARGWQVKEIRLQERYAKKPGLVAFLWAVEEAIHDFDGDDFYALFKTLTVTVRGKARKWARLSSNKRLSVADFESILWEATWRFIENDPWRHQQDYMLFETLRVMLDRRAIDVLRAASTKQEAFERSAVSLDALLESEVSDSESRLALADPQVDVENTVVNREVVHQMLRDERLSDGERELLHFQYEYPDATYRNLASMMGFKHPEQVRRVFKAIASKLNEYNVA